MAGGLFVNQPFHPNIKCIVFSVILVVMYWFAPRKNLLVAALIAIIAYIAMAWYDWYYNCEGRMYTGSSGLQPDVIFKPTHDHGKKDKKDLVDDQEGQKKINTYVFHLLIVAPILIYTGIKGLQMYDKVNFGINQDKNMYNVFPALTGFGALAALYHGYRLLSV